MKSTMSVFVLLATVTATAIAQTPARESRLLIEDDQGGKQELYFGVDAVATAGLDSSLNEVELPPFPPDGVFDARLIGDDIGILELGLGSYRDYRAGDSNFEGEIEHEIKFQPTTGSTRLTFRWNLTTGATGKLEDLFGGVVLNATMTDTGSVVLTNLSVDKLKMVITYGTPTSVRGQETSVPGSFALQQNYPNPFNPTTQITYDIAVPGRVRLFVYDIQGREVAQLVDQHQQSGRYQVNFSASGLASGLYVYTLKTAGSSRSRKMLFTK